MLKELVGER